MIIVQRMMAARHSGFERMLSIETAFARCLSTENGMLAVYHKFDSDGKEYEGNIWVIVMFLREVSSDGRENLFCKIFKTFQKSVES